MFKIKKEVIVISVILLLVLAIIWIKENPKDEPINKAAELTNAINYAKNTNPSFKTCMNAGVPPEIGIATEGRLALYCAEKTGNLELYKLIESLQ